MFAKDASTPQLTPARHPLNVEDQGSLDLHSRAWDQAHDKD